MLLVNYLNAFQKPKWKHRNPEIRKQGIAELDANQQKTLIQIAWRDTDVNVRCAAISRLNDLDELKILQSEDEPIRHVARERFKVALSGAAEDGPAFIERLDALDICSEDKIIEYVAQHGAEPELRLYAILKVKRQSLLGDIALNDPVSTNRMRAAELITKRSTLERVVKNSKGKDKVVHRLTRTKLDDIIEEELRPERLKSECSDLCSELERILKRDRYLVDKPRFEEIAKRWNEVGHLANVGLSASFRINCNKIRSAIKVAEETQIRLAKEVRLREKKELICNQLDILVNKWMNHPDEVEKYPLEQHLFPIINNWQQLEKLEKEEEQRFQKRFDQITSTLYSLRERSVEAKFVVEQDRKLCERAKSMLISDEPLNEKSVHQLEATWIKLSQRELPWTGCKPTQFNSVLEHLKQRIEEQNSKRTEFISSLEAEFDSIEKELDEGHIETARFLHKLAQEKLEYIETVSSSGTANLRKKFNVIQKQLFELNNWHHWAKDREREALCRKAEALDPTQKDLQDLANQVKTLQDAWKKLGGKGREGLWKRFNDACEVAYEPCKARFEKQAELRQANQSRKEIICQQLEKYIDSMDWSVSASSHINWKQVEQTAKIAKKEWKEAGPVDHNVQKALDDRFNSAIKRIFDELKSEWRRNQLLKEQLIDEAKVIAEQADSNHLASAIKAIKELQKEWKNIGFAGRRKNRALWGAFRKYCDLVFGARKQQQDQHKQAQSEHLSILNDICKQLANLQTADISADELSSKVEALRSKWQAASKIADAAIIKTCHRRYKKLCQQLSSKLSDLQMQKSLNSLSVLEKKADICKQLESGNIDSETLERLKVEWSQLETLPDIFELAIAHRYEQASAAVASQQPITTDILRENEKQLEKLCIQMEILAELDSPKEQQQARLEYQVKQLEDTLSGKVEAEKAPKIEQGLNLQREWYSTGPVSETAHEKLLPRFRMACETLLKDNNSNHPSL